MTARNAERRVEIVVDNRRFSVASGVTVAAALFDLGVWSLRESVTGTPRGPLCGMGICFECRVTIDGVAHRRACLTSVRDGMSVTTAATGASSARSTP